VFCEKRILSSVRRRERKRPKKQKERCTSRQERRIAVDYRGDREKGRMGMALEKLSSKKAGKPPHLSQSGQGATMPAMFSRKRGGYGPSILQEK